MHHRSHDQEGSTSRGSAYREGLHRGGGERGFGITPQGVTMGQQADGTHPTGIHSCFCGFVVRWRILNGIHCFVTELRLFLRLNRCFE